MSLLSIIITLSPFSQRYYFQNSLEGQCIKPNLYRVFSAQTHTHTQQRKSALIEMGCFLACFGFKEKKKKKKKRRQPGNHSYVPLDSDVSIKLDIEENLTSDSSHLKEKPKEPSILKLKKKVRFNLNVKAYEPIPDNDDVSIYLSDGEEETKFDTETKSTGDLHYEEDAIASYPASYRYQNCRDSDDEEEDEDLKLDLDLDETEESDEEVDDVSSNQSDDGLPGEEESDNDATKNQVPKQEKTSLESKSNARDRSRYVSSVLNPVENLSQWRVVKAKATAPYLKLQKENSMSKQDGNRLSSTKPYSESPASMNRPGHAIAADASLSNWLSSFETRPVTKSSSSGQ